MSLNTTDPPKPIDIANLVANVGVPAALAFYILFSLTPQINHGIDVANHVEEDLRIVETYCINQPKTRGEVQPPIPEMLPVLPPGP